MDDLTALSYAHRSMNDNTIQFHRMQIKQCEIITRYWDNFDSLLRDEAIIDFLHGLNWVTLKQKLALLNPHVPVMGDNFQLMGHDSEIIKRYLVEINR